MDNFDLRKYLAENKLTANSKLLEENPNQMEMKLAEKILEKHIRKFEEKYPYHNHALPNKVFLEAMIEYASIMRTR